jgi:hypothetical protein
VNPKKEWAEYTDVKWRESIHGSQLHVCLWRFKQLREY